MKIFIIDSASIEEFHQQTKPDLVVVSHLTDRELALLTYLADGQTDKIIAQMLHISPRTVRYGIQTLCTKFEVENRMQLVVKVVRLGLI